MQHLEVNICADAEDAVKRGFVYREGFKAVSVEKAVVVRNGTVEGNATVDFILQDEEGKKYVFMITGNLLKSIPC